MTSNLHAQHSNGRTPKLNFETSTAFEEIIVKKTTHFNQIPEVVQEFQPPPHHKHHFARFKRFKKLAHTKAHAKTSWGEASMGADSCSANSSRGSNGTEEERVVTDVSMRIRRTFNIANDAKEVGDDNVDLHALADIVLQLIDSLPVVIPSNVSASMPSPGSSPTFNKAPGFPFPPITISANDKYLMDLLSDQSIMNGDQEKGRPSVWTILHSLTFPHVQEDSDGRSLSPPSASGTNVMLYLPLQPTVNDKIQLAESQLIFVANLPVRTSSTSSVSLATTVAVVDPLATDEVIHGPFGWKWWPFHHKHDKKSSKRQESKSSSTPQNTPKITTSSTPTSLVPAPCKVPKQIWLPSRTKFSIEATWWGYRIFLPPPVMAILDNDENTIVQRATMITTALTWLLDNIPLAILPPPVQPVLLILQRIVPYVNDIGSFIAWSWENVKEYDTGYGVILNATWLLPVALIPSTWKVDSFPGATPTKNRSTVTVGSTKVAHGVPESTTDIIGSKNAESEKIIAAQDAIANGTVTQNSPNFTLVGKTRFVEAFEENPTVKDFLAPTEFLDRCTKTELEVVPEEDEVEILEEEVLPVFQTLCLVK
ncbi:hypothetical protein C8R42DRAFT_716687 [Lentinula raphanica]|nr:hypothetical protein C8R42DRAFT_716687 [Lentinula raphanica]